MHPTKHETLTQHTFRDLFAAVRMELENESAAVVRTGINRSHMTGARVDWIEGGPAIDAALRRFRNSISADPAVLIAMARASA